MTTDDGGSRGPGTLAKAAVLLSFFAERGTRWSVREIAQELDFVEMFAQMGPIAWGVADRFREVEVELAEHARPDTLDRVLARLHEAGASEVGADAPSKYRRALGSRERK